jgi:ATP/maltotriose-dependent transcriptional regulator MalT/DNA-binding SARP family transcriptional activator
LSDIKHAYPLILNKVASPHYATPTLRRARLIDWLNEAAACRAAVIAADAGYGKTTLLWQWEREVDFPCYWYKLDRTDRDWTFHISYLIEAISKRHKGFGRRAHSMLQQLGGPGSSRPGVAAYLLAEMHERLTEPCTFIIDDWQFVNAVTEVRGLWNQILRDAPPTCRFIFASRVKPRLQFARFKTHAGYAELTTDALRFTEPEIDDLFRDIYNDPLEPSELAELERRTEGWAASLQLVEVSLRERSSPDERRGFIESITATSDSDLFEFLAEEVLDQQPEETRNFLLSTSILQQITPEVAERLAGVHDGMRELSGLEHRGLFTNRLDEHRYRYHNLFRDFLERRLMAERSDAEVIGLHIHAASYFETTHQWPEAIHHYLRAGLKRQAARLIAKYGEDVVSSGRLGLVDEWVHQLPQEAIKQNARLSLLYGEASGIRGEWEGALEALQRGREYFSRKGDRRMEALACLKLSTVFSNYGDAERAALVAEAGLELVPPDAASTRLRLQGNLAVTRTRAAGSLDEVVRICQRVAVEATALGLDHFAAIGHHNAGEAQLRMGQVKNAIANLERAARFWGESPTHPFADNEDLAVALLFDGQIGRASAIAVEAVRRCAPWARPKAYALNGLASVLTSEGRLDEAIRAAREVVRVPRILGAGISVFYARLIELLYLTDAPAAEINLAREQFAAWPHDSRYSADVAPALAIVDHASPSCDGACQRYLEDLAVAHEAGAILTACIGRVKIGALAFEHSGFRAKREAWTALANASNRGFLGPMRAWVRRYAPHVRHARSVEGGPALLSSLVDLDPEGWRAALVAALPKTTGADRAGILHSIVQHANRETIEELRTVRGDDAAEARRQLKHHQAARLYLRTFGAIALRRGGWDGPAIAIDKRRVRALLAVLGAHAHTTLTRDMAIDILWPDADGDAAVNSLNQTVFQLRRFIDPGYRQGESPEYVLSSADQIALNGDLVRTDIQAIRSLPDRLAEQSWAHRQALTSRTIDLIQGEFLADLRYENWAARLQLSVHNDVRSRLLPIAQQSAGVFDVQVATAAATALVLLDPFDESATIALADCLARSGKKIAARDLLVRYAEQVRSELDEDPSDTVMTAAARLGRVGQT